MKDTILFKIGMLFICMTELGNIIGIQDTEDNRNPEIGPLKKMGVEAFEKKNSQSPVILTGENLAEVIKQAAGGLGAIIDPLIAKNTELEKKFKDLEERHKLLFDEFDTYKAGMLLKKPEKNLVSDPNT